MGRPVSTPRSTPTRSCVSGPNGSAPGASRTSTCSRTSITTRTRSPSSTPSGSVSSWGSRRGADGLVEGGTDEDERVAAGLRAPELARTPEELPHVGARRELERREALRFRLEAHDGLRRELGEPHDVTLVDVQRIRRRMLTGEGPLAPLIDPGVVDADPPSEPLGEPEPAAGVGPDAARPGLARRRLEDGDAPRPDLDLPEVAARKRGEPHLALRRRRDSVRPLPARRVEHVDLSARWVEPADDPGLPGEPEDAAPVERRGVEALTRPRYGPAPDLARDRVDADDRVETAVGDPGRAIRTDDDAVRSRAAAERDALHLAGRGIEPPELAGTLAGEPHPAIARGRDVVRAHPRRHGVGRHTVGPGRGHRGAHPSRRRRTGRGRDRLRRQVPHLARAAGGREQEPGGEKG